MAPGAIRKATGGANIGALWMDHIFDDLRLQNKTIRVLYASTAEGEGVLDDNTSYSAYKEKEAHLYTAALENVFEKELETFSPDIIHIWGTEYGHTLAMVNAAEKTGCLGRLVISIQGLCSVIAQHYAEGIPHQVQQSNTFRDFIKHNNIRAQQKKFALRGKMEIKALEKARHVIGRTEWDKACTTQINPSVQYHHCNETLRKEFYDGQWTYKNCNKHKIFCASGEYPVKGAHYVLEALNIITEKYPDASVTFSGSSPFPRKDMLEKLRYSVYAKYLNKLMIKHNLQEKIKFAGFLGAEQMREQYLKANVFVSASTIENSPNSLGEAMLLGVPCVASNVGGVTDLLSHKKEGFVYQSTAPYMLAHYIMEVFAMQDKAEQIGAAAKQKAVVTHSPEANCNRLLDIYYKIQEQVI